jgi:hypothetical protein
MAIFARRTIQRMLRENSTFSEPAQLRDFARKLNKADQKSIHSEWELALLNVFAKRGQVAHERQFVVTFVIFHSDLLDTQGLLH